MPRGLNLKTFGRRKSSGNALDFEESATTTTTTAATSPQSTFKVLERPGKSSTYNAQNARTFNSPLNTLRGKSVDNLGLGVNRGSAGTTNSGSSGYYDSSSASARHSSTSTLPSSLDQERVDDETLFSVRKAPTSGMYRTTAPTAEEQPLPPTPSFTTRAARALSFGQKHGRPSKDIPAVPLPQIPTTTSSPPGPQRERAMTTSSYASTAVPPKTELTFGADFGKDDFSEMFASLKKEIPLHPPRVESAGAFHRTDSEPMYPPRTLSRNALTPSPRHEMESPYYSDDRGSNDGLVSSSALSSPTALDGNMPGPAVGNGIAQAFLGASQSGYSRVPERYASPGLERSASVDSYSSVMDDVKGKEPEYVNRQTHIEDEDRWVRRVELSDAPMPSPAPSKATPASTNAFSRHLQSPMQKNNGPSRRGPSSPVSTGEESLFSGSNTTTPRAARSAAKSISEHALYDSSPVGPASRAIRPSTATQGRTESGGPKKMTKAQFQALQSREESHSEESEEEHLSGDDYDAEDDLERAKQMATQRRKQEANMSVYRQQMKKVTGGGPTDLPASGASTIRPSTDRASSASAFHLGGVGGQPPADVAKGRMDEEEDDDVPLGILQAHGFPSGSRPPTRTADNDINHQRRTSTAGSVVGGGAGQGNLPPFARRLPADPYFGAGLVNQQTRESLAMNSSGASVMGMPTGPMPQSTPLAHPGGLVGVIAGEERARAARRGSPNPATMGGNGMPLPPGMQQPPPMPRTMSMGNMVAPSMYGGAPPMPAMPQMGGMGMMNMAQMGMPQMQLQPGSMDPGQQQLQQFMSMQMQFMQNMLSMQAQMGQTPTAPMGQPTDYLGVNFGNNAQRPMSMASQTSAYQQGPPQLNQGRSMTMLNPPTGWNAAAQPGGSRPSSAVPMAQGSYAPSVSGLNLSGGGPGPGYTPSIAPSERSNIGMPSRYRPVTQNGDTSRSQSMTSSLTLNAFASQQTAPSPGTPFNASQAQTPKPTIRIIEKPKGAPKVSVHTADEDEDDGWLNMRKKRDEKKKSKWGRKDKTASTSTAEPSLGELYHGLD